MNNNMVRSWLFTLLALLENTEVIEASRTENGKKITIEINIK